MKAINFETTEKEYKVNGNTVIHVDTADFGIVDRLYSMRANAKKLAESYNEVDETAEGVIDLLGRIDKDIRSEIDKVFGDGIAGAVFGKVNAISVCNNGAMLFENFMNAIVPAVEADMKEAQKLRDKHVLKYTSKVKR